MNVIVMIQGREAIPVRAIPLLTNWRFMSPDIVAHVLGGTGGSTVSVFGALESYCMENGQVVLIKEDWWAQSPLKKLCALSKKIKATESIDEAGYSTWQELSLKELPAGVFVWKDDYQRLHDKNWNDRFRMTYCALKNWNGEESDEDVESQMQRDLARDLRFDDMVDDTPLKRDLRESLEVLKRWREPDYHPFIGKELSAIVKEGFVPQITTELLKRMESVEYQSATGKIEAAERLLRDANQNLLRRRETLKNAPGTGDIQKLEDAERAVQVAESGLASATKVHKTMRGDFLDEPQQLAPESQAGPGWKLKTSIERAPGYRWPLYQVLKAAHMAGQPCPKARDVLTTWTVRPPPDVQVMPDGVKYNDGLGNPKEANLKAIQQAIKGLLKPARRTSAAEVPNTPDKGQTGRTT